MVEKALMDFIVVHKIVNRRVLGVNVLRRMAECLIITWQKEN